jgi:uncharacterized protein YjbJ (UPF0337 family)
VANPTEIKGRAKQAAGDLTDDEELKREGDVDRGSGKLKDKIEDVADKVKHLVNRDRD